MNVHPNVFEMHNFQKKNMHMKMKFCWGLDKHIYYNLLLFSVDKIFWNQTVFTIFGWLLQKLMEIVHF